MAGLITEKNNDKQLSKTAITYWIVFLVMLIYWSFPIFKTGTKDNPIPKVPDTLFYVFSSLIGVGVFKNGLHATEKIIKEKKQNVQNSDNINNNRNPS